MNNNHYEKNNKIKYEAIYPRILLIDFFWLLLRNKSHTRVSIFLRHFGFNKKVNIRRCWLSRFFNRTPLQRFWAQNKNWQRTHLRNHVLCVDVWLKIKTSHHHRRHYWRNLDAELFFCVSRKAVGGKNLSGLGRSGCDVGTFGICSEWTSPPLDEDQWP